MMGFGRAVQILHLPHLFVYLFYFRLLLWHLRCGILPILSKIALGDACWAMAARRSVTIGGYFFSTAPTRRCLLGYQIFQDFQILH